MITEEMKALKDERIGHGLGDTNGLSWAWNYSRLFSGLEIVIREKDKNILRGLAKRVAEIAARPEQEEKANLWRQHNALEETRPMIFCDPENAWYEIFPADRLTCTGDVARMWEFQLLKEIYWAEKIKDDRVTDSAFYVYYIFTESDRGIDSTTFGGENGGSVAWDTPLNDYRDVDKMQFKKFIVDFAKTGQLYSLASEVFRDILEVKLAGAWWFSLGMTSDLLFLRGFERMWLDFYDHPDGVHRLMAFLRDENLARLDYLEQNGLLSLNNRGDFVGTGGYGWSYELPSAGYDGKKVRPVDMWGYCQSQEMAGVSAKLFEEFVFPYELPILERFGLNIYGCCEPLDNRWHIIKKIPRLRKVTVSPWSDVNVMAENLGKDYIFCRKVNPAFVSTPEIDEQSARAELRETFTATRKNNCRVQVLERDVMTLSWNPNNAIRWTQIAREESANIYGA